MSAAKPKLAVYWASGCGGCEIAFANLGEKLLEVTEAMDFVFCPCLLDTKRHDIEAMADGDITVTLFDGAIRTDENKDWARLMRRKSKILVALGACAHGEGIPALSNLHTQADHLHTIYFAQADNPTNILPSQSHGVDVPEGRLEMPTFHARVKRLADVVPVDYAIPGCPPEIDQIWNAIHTLLGAAPLPPTGAVLGGGAASVCAECSRKRTDKRVTTFRRVWEFIPDPDICLLDQGIACMGVATRGGCGGLCPKVQMPCIGCYGAPEGVWDQSTKMVSTLGGVLDIAPIRALREEVAIEGQVDTALDSLVDIAGLVGKFHSVRGKPAKAAAATKEST